MSPFLVFALYGAVTVGLAWLLAGHMHRVFTGRRASGCSTRLIAPVERGCFLPPPGPAAGRGQTWSGYAMAVLVFNLVGFLLLYAILRLQGMLPWNPQGIGPMAPDLAFNTAISFVTNTNWQAYSGEVQLSYMSQMVGLTVQNFVSAATGMAIAVAIVRGFAAKGDGRLGNFWVDATRAVLYILLPLSILAAVVLIWQGVPQSLSAYVRATTLEGAGQVIAQGPAAAQIAIKQLGTNGGGFFNANSAHPFENPTILSNMIQSVYLLLIPVAFCFLFGRMVGDRRQGWAIFAAMGVLFVAGLLLMNAPEQAGNPALAQATGITGPNMEGKEVRFGATLSVLWAEATTAASNGSVNAMHDSFMPLSGLVMMLNMQVGEVIFGGVGSGLYGMLLYVVLAVFLAGLMVGRTPEYLGKKIEGREVTLCRPGLPVDAPGHPGLRRAVGGGAGGAGGGAGCGAPWPVRGPLCLQLGHRQQRLGLWRLRAPARRSTPDRAGVADARWGAMRSSCRSLAVAPDPGDETPVPATAGTFPTHGPLFVLLLVITVLILGALTFLPALVLGPIAEHVSMLGGQAF